MLQAEHDDVVIGAAHDARFVASGASGRNAGFVLTCRPPNSRMVCDNALAKQYEVPWDGAIHLGSRRRLWSHLLRPQ